MMPNGRAVSLDFRAIKVNQARSMALRALLRIERDQAYSDIVISTMLAKHSLTPSDTGLFNELVRGTVRWRKRLDWMIDGFWDRKGKELPISIRNILRLGFYQLAFLDRIPPFAAVDECVSLARFLMGKKWAGVVNGVLRGYLRDPGQVKYPNAKNNPVLAMAVKKSHPEWLIEKWFREFGPEETARLCDANNRPSLISIRLNGLKISGDDFEGWLKTNRLVYEKSRIPGYYRLPAWSAKIKSAFLNTGLLTIQDESAGLSVLMADVQPGMKIVDLCAAPGGKTSHLAEMATDKATILAGDVLLNRVTLLKKTLSRLMHDFVHVVVADAVFFPARAADIVLLDVPCSGLGVLSKKADLRWHRKPEDIHDLVRKQRVFIHRAADLVKQGGSLIYCTCTMNHEENEEIVDYFLQSRKDFDLAHPDNKEIPKEFIGKNGFVKTLPHRDGMDGSFTAKLVKRG